MSWKPLNLRDSEYKKRVESLRDKMIQIRDTMLAEEKKKLDHLADVMIRVNEHKERQKNVVDT